MDKHIIIAQLRRAKTAHIRWRSYAQALVSGVPLDEGKVPVLHTDCAFGKWYYGSGQALSEIASFRAIEQPHEQLHMVYMEIFKHLFAQENRGLFARLIGSKRQHNHHTARAVESLMNELLKISERLIGHIDELEQVVLAMDEEKVALLV